MKNIEECWYAIWLESRSDHASAEIIGALTFIRVYSQTDRQKSMKDIPMLKIACSIVNTHPLNSRRSLAVGVSRSIAFYVLRCVVGGVTAIALLIMPAMAVDLPKSVDIVTSDAPPPTEDQLAFNNVYQLNRSMQTIFSSGLSVTQDNIRNRFPLIMGLFSDSGGRFILYRPGQPPLDAPPVPQIYQIAKAVAHSSLAAYGLVVPALKDPKANQSWVAPMLTFRTQVQTARDSLDNLTLTPDEKSTVRAVLDRVQLFLDTCLKNGTFTYVEVEEFARGVEPFAEKLIGLAAKAQVSHWYEVLAEWKVLLGTDWDHTYALTNSLFPTRQNNILFTIMAQFMGEEKINRQLFMFETTDFQTTPEEMFTLYARHINDRGLSKVFFNYEYLMSHELLNGGARKVIASESERRGMKLILPPLAPLNSNEWPWIVNQEKGSGPRSLEDLHSQGYLPPLPN